MKRKLCTQNHEPNRNLVKYSIKITMKRFIEELITETHIIVHDISSNHTK